MSKQFVKYYSVYCEGKQEELYFRKLSSLIREQTGRKIQNIYHERKYKNVLAAGNSEYDCVLVFDYDNNEEEFKKILKIYNDYNRIQKRKRKDNQTTCYHAYSNISFDLWLILHKNSGYNKPANRAFDYQNEIRRLYNLPNEADIKEETIIGKILEQINLNDVCNAVKSAKRICENNKQYKEPHCYEGLTWYDNPDMSIHTFTEKLLIESNIVIE